MLRVAPVVGRQLYLPQTGFPPRGDCHVVADNVGHLGISFYFFDLLERAKGFEPSPPTLARIASAESNARSFSRRARRIVAVHAVTLRFLAPMRNLEL